MMSRRRGPLLPDHDLLVLLRTLETDLHRPAVRQDPVRVGELLHADFREIGRSGTLYDRDAILALLVAETSDSTVAADRFELLRLAGNAALLNYRSAERAADGSLAYFALRSSLWTDGGAGWKMVFHQGTPTAPFALEPVATA